MRLRPWQLSSLGTLTQSVETDDSRDQILGEVGTEGAGAGSGLDGCGPQLLLINCGGELRMILCGRKLSFVVRNWGLFCSRFGSFHQLAKICI